MQQILWIRAQVFCSHLVSLDKWTSPLTSYGRPPQQLQGALQFWESPPSETQYWCGSPNDLRWFFILSLKVTNSYVYWYGTTMDVYLSNCYNKRKAKMCVCVSVWGTHNKNVKREKVSKKTKQNIKMPIIRLSISAIWMNINELNLPLKEKNLCMGWSESKKK